MKLPAFIGGSYPARSATALTEHSINCYVEPLPPPAKNVGMLLPTPGEDIYSPASASFSSPGRALRAHGGRVFAVIGSEFVEITLGGGRVVRGAVATDSEPATISSLGDGGRQLAITSAGVLYNFNVDTAAFAVVGTYPGVFAHDAVMLDGYIVVLDRSSSTIYQSALYDGTSFDGTAFGQRSIAPDPWKRIVVHNRELWLLGDQTSEVWYNAQAFPFTFQAHPASKINYGVAAPWSAVSLGESLIWVSRSELGHLQVVEARGFDARVVSTPALDHLFADYTVTEDAIGWGYSERGHLFYVLTFPSADRTWVYDLTTGLWHERGEWVPENLDYRAWRPLYHCQAFDAHLSLNVAGGEVFHLHDDVGTHASGRAIRRVRQAPSITRERDWLFFARFELIMDTGLGLLEGQGSDPTLELQYSNDGGRTWKSAGTRRAGRMGDYGKDVVWRRLGRSSDRVFRIIMTDPIPWRIVDALIDVEAA